MNYIVLEIQTFDNGASSALATAYSDENMANQAYHTALAAAAVSELPTHSCVLVDERGMFIEAESFDHGKEE